MEDIAPKGATATFGISRAPQFSLTKFRPPELPDTLVTRSRLHDRLAAGAGGRLTIVVGSAGAGKTVLLADWAGSRPPDLTSWLSCDSSDDDQVRFWVGFVEASRALDSAFGADAIDLLMMDDRMSPDVVASIANDAAKLPAGTVIVVDDFHFAGPAVARDMTDLVECWPADNAELVLASRSDPPLRLHRMRLDGELCEIRDRDIYFSLEDSRELMANFDIHLPDADLNRLHQRSEGWPAALQMATLSLRNRADPARVAEALDVGSHAITEYFVDEVLDQQPPEVAQFMLDTSVLGELTAAVCVVVTRRNDAAALLRRVDAAHLFLVALDEERTTFRYHHLVSQTLRAELRARDPARERLLHLRSAEWFESDGAARHAARHFLAARQPHRALALLRDHGLAGFLQHAAEPAPLDLSAVSPGLIADAPDDLLALATDLLLSGDIVRGGQYLDLLERAQPSIKPGPSLMSRLSTMRAFRYAMNGQLDLALGAALRARAIREQYQLSDAFSAAVPVILLRIYPALEIPDAVDREAAAALEMPGLPEPARMVLVPGAQALALALAGHLTEAADAARGAADEAHKLGFGQHLFAIDYLRAMAVLALEQRDLNSAERLIETVLRICERRWPLLEFLALLDRAKIWAAAGQPGEALDTVNSARAILAEACSGLRFMADGLEADLRLSLGDLRTSVDLANRLVPRRSRLLLAKTALAAGDHGTASGHLAALPHGLAPRQALEREILLAAVAIERGDPAVSAILGGALHLARRQGFFGTVITTSPQVTEYLVEHAAELRMDPFVERLVSAALEIRAARQCSAGNSRLLAEPLTNAEHRILQLLPTSTYAQIANSLYISRNTVKTHLRSIYQKLGVTSRSEAIERAVSVRLL
jgi:LuxR family maltose regulon positive regulatory protein